MQWTRSRQDISKERLTQDASGWRVWAWYGPLGLAFILVLGWNADTLGQGRTPSEKALALEPVIVTATVAPTPLGRTTAPVTVISREQIAAQQATGVTELLRQVPGVHIDQAGARGGISSVYVRGSDPNFTVVLIDGVKVNDPTNSRGGSFDFSTLSTDNMVVLENSNVEKLASNQYLLVQSCAKEDRYDTDDASPREIYSLLVPESTMCAVQSSW